MNVGTGRCYRLLALEVLPLRVPLLSLGLMLVCGCNSATTADAGRDGTDASRGDAAAVDAGTTDASPDARADAASPTCADAAMNACGGCAPLEHQPADACGRCGRDLWACDGTEAVRCSGDRACAHGSPCTADAQCEGGYCSPNGCAPVGWSFVPAGTFLMGAPPTERGFHSGRENGQHTVVLTRDFLVQRTTVTQAQWADLMGGTRPSMFTTCGDQCPVVNVTWFEMLAYANTLSRRDGLPECYTLVSCVGTIGAGCAASLDHCNGYQCDLAPLSALDLDCAGYRLPTEAEWEYFARAGTTTAFITPSGTYDNWSPDVYDAEMDSIAWFIDNSAVTYSPSHDCSIWWPSAGPCGPHPVGLKLPNNWALFDITGNVYERVWDWSGDYPPPGSTVTDPTGPETGTQRRMRGGSFNLWGQYLRVAYRTGPVPESAYYNIGFRLVRTLL